MHHNADIIQVTTQESALLTLFIGYKYTQFVDLQSFFRITRIFFQ